MATSDPGEILLRHHRWANERLLRACEGLTDEQLDRPFEMGPGTLRKTLAHIASTIRGWDDLLAGRPKRPWLNAEGYSFRELRELFERVTSDFESSAREHPVDGIAIGGSTGSTYSYVRGGVVAHVLAHGIHHRAQCLNMLRAMGAEPLPECDVDIWMTSEEPV